MGLHVVLPSVHSAALAAWARFVGSAIYITICIFWLPCGCTTYKLFCCLHAASMPSMTPNVRTCLSPGTCGLLPIFSAGHNSCLQDIILSYCSLYAIAYRLRTSSPPKAGFCLQGTLPAIMRHALP